jgi:hypothetical protein
MVGGPFRLPNSLQARSVRGTTPRSATFRDRPPNPAATPQAGRSDHLAYSGSFLNIDSFDDEESRELSGSGPFRHMSFHTFGGGEMSRTLFTNESGPICALRQRPDSPWEPMATRMGPRGGSRVQHTGLSEPIPETSASFLSGEGDATHQSLSASISPASVSVDNTPGPTPGPSPSPPSTISPSADALAQALGHLSIPGDATHMPSAPSARRASRVARNVMAGISRADLHGMGVAQGECIPLQVRHWSQDHASVTIFLQLERFNPASLMVQIQQQSVVVMAMNADGPNHVFMMRPEHPVRVQGSKSRPQPGNGIQIILQVRVALFLRRR